MKSNSKIKLFTASAALVISFQTSASLGNLEVRSYLGEPFFGTIAVDGAEASFLLKNGTVSLSNSNLNAEVRKLGKQYAIINIYSKTLINTPILTFEVGVGSQLRQYTAIINPAHYHSKSVTSIATIPSKTPVPAIGTALNIDNKQHTTSSKTIITKKATVKEKPSTATAADSDKPTIQTNRSPVGLTQNTSSIIGKTIAAAQEPIPATLPETATPATLPEAATPATLPETATPATLPEAATPATLPETATPATLPETATPATLPEAATPATLPEAATPATLPETATPAKPLVPTHTAAIPNTYNQAYSSLWYWLIRLVPAGLIIILTLLFLLKKRKKAKSTKQETFEKTTTPTENSTTNHTASVENELVTTAVYANAISQLDTQSGTNKIISVSQDAFLAETSDDGTNLNETENIVSETNNQTTELQISQTAVEETDESVFLPPTFGEPFDTPAEEENKLVNIQIADNPATVATEIKAATNNITAQNPDKMISVSNELFSVETSDNSTNLSETENIVSEVNNQTTESQINQTTVEETNELLPLTFGEPFDTPAEEENKLANIQIADNPATVATEIKTATNNITVQNPDKMISVNNGLFSAETNDDSANLSETENIISEINNQTTEPQINQIVVKEADESAFPPLAFGESLGTPAEELQISQTTVEETDELLPLTFGEPFDTPAEEENKLVNIQIADSPVTETFLFKDEQPLEFYPNNPDDDFSVQPINIKPNTEDNLAPIETTNINLSNTEISDVDRLSFVEETNIQESLASIEPQKINTETFTLPTAEDTDTTPPN